jgi:hypothetical protein
VLSSRNFLPGAPFRSDRFEARDAALGGYIRINAPPRRKLTRQPMRIGCLVDRLRIKESLR